MQDHPGAPGSARQRNPGTDGPAACGGAAVPAPQAWDHVRSHAVPVPLPLPLALDHVRSGAASLPLAPAHVRSGAASLPLAPPGQPGPASADRSVLRSTDLWPAHASRPLQAVLPRVPATSRHLDCPPAHHLNRHSHASRSHTPLRGVNPRPPVATGGPPGGYAPATRVTHSHAHTDLLSQHTTHQVHLAIQVPPRPRSCSTACTGFSRQRQSRAPPPPAHRKPTYPSPVIPPLHMVERGPGDGLKPHHTWHYPCGFGPSEGEVRPKPPSLHADSRAGTGRLL